MTTSTGRQKSDEAAEFHDNHGNSLAAWTSVIIIMIGSLIMSGAVLMMSTPVFVIGVIVVLLGVVAGKVLSSMGYGSPPLPKPGARH